jgi:hypothetical protein
MLIRKKTGLINCSNSHWGNTLFIFSKFCFILIFVLVCSINSSAQVTTLSAWSNIYHGTSTSAQTATVTIPAGTGSNRLLVVGIASDRTTGSGAGTRTVTLTYGGQSLTSANNDMGTSSIQHTGLYYLNEAGIDAASGTTLSVTVSGGTTRMTDVWVSAYDNVDQSSPITDSKNYNSGASTTTNPVFGTALTVNANDQALEVINCDRTSSTTLRTITYAANWTMSNQQTSTVTDAIRNAVVNRSIPGSNTTDVSSTTFSGNALGSMTGISLKYGPPSPMTFSSCTTTQTNVTSVSPGASAQEIIGIQIVTSGSGSPLAATSFTVNANGTTAIADINSTNSAKVYYTGTSSTFATTTLFGQSTPTIADYNITGSQTLSNGTNYFWLVYDIQAGATLGDYVDAECTSLTVTSARTPTISAPGGNRQIAGYSYRSRATGNWNDYTNVWQVSCNGGAWADVTTGNSLSPYYPTSANSYLIEICEGHYISANVVITAPNTTVDYGGTLYLPAGSYRLTYGTGYSLTNNGTVTISAGGSSDCTGYSPPGSPCPNKWDGYGLIIDGGTLTNNYASPSDTNQLWINATGVITCSMTTGGSTIINNGYINNNGGYYYWTGGVGGNEYVQWSGIYYYCADHSCTYTATFDNYGYVSNYSATNTAAGWYRTGLGSFYDLNNYGTGTYGNFNTRAATNVYHNFVNYNGGTINNGSNFTTYCTGTNHGIYYEDWATNIDNAATSFSVNSSFTNASDGVFNILADGAIRIETSTSGNSSFTNDGIINNNCVHSLSSFFYGIDLITSSGTTNFTNSSTGIIYNYGHTQNSGTFTNNGTIYNDISALGYAYFSDTVYTSGSSHYGTMTNNNIFYDNGKIYLGNSASNSFTNTSGSQFIYQTVSTSFSGSQNLKYTGTALLDYNGTIAQTTSTKEWPTAANIPTYVEIDNSSGAANGVTLNGARTIDNMLTLTNGALKLNLNTLTINNSSASAIARDGTTQTGYIVSEQDAATNNSKILWNCGTTTGSFVFPFGANDGSYIPLTFNKTTAGSSNITLSTRATAASNNVPLATGVSNMNCLAGGDGSVPSVIDRWWDISPSAAVTGDVTFSYRGSENTTGDPLSEIAVQHWHSTGGGYWNDGMGGGAGAYVATGANGVTSGVGSVTATGLSEFSPYILVLRNNFLPVELLNFSAVCDDKTVKLSWTTASETNNDYFTVERSINTLEWEPIIKVNGSGTTNNYSNYYAEDISPYLDKASYYRLNQVDYDGMSTYSDVAATDCSISENQIIFNFAFADGDLNLFFSNVNTDYALSIYDASGKLVYTNDIKKSAQQSQQLVLNGDLFSSGLYIIQLQSIDDSVVRKFMVR